jgi:hypothetical protein
LELVAQVVPLNLLQTQKEIMELLAETQVLEVTQRLAEVVEVVVGLILLMVIMVEI